MRRGSLLIGWALIAMALSSATEALAQSAEVSGVVADPLGAVIPAATVTLVNEDTGIRRGVTSNSTGNYDIPFVTPGRYKITVQADGFRAVTQTGVELEVGRNTRFDFTLTIGSTVQAVEVTAGTTLLQHESSSLGQVVQARTVVEMPLNGRNVMNLTALIPSVIPEGQSMQNPTGANIYAWGNYQINGDQGNTSATFIDGVPVNADHAHLLSLVPTQDSIQEFNVQTSSLAAEWGRLAGGVINFVTKSGTNRFHGSAYEFLRNTEINANTFFNNASGISKPAFIQNQFGTNAGGPLVIPGAYDGRSKTFWFTSYEGFRQRVGKSSLLTVPTPDERRGDFSNLRDQNGNLIPLYDPTTTQPNPENPGHYLRNQISCNNVLNVICPGQIDSVARNLESLWPLPNLPGLPFTNINNYATNAVTGGDNDQVTARVDQNISDRQRFFGRFTYWSDSNLAWDPYGTHVYSDRGPETFRAKQIVLGDTYFFSPTAMLDLRLNYLRFAYNRTPESVGFDLTSLGWPSSWVDQIPGWLRTLPSICIADSGIGSVSCGYGTGSVIVDRADDYSFIPTLTKITGRHTLRMGGMVEVQRDNYAQTNDASPGFDFNANFTASDPFSPVGGFGFASFLLGYPLDGSADIPSLTAGQQIYRAVYLQDSYHATRRLTLNLGLRYDLQGPWSERFNRLSFFLPNAASQLAQLTGLPLVGRLGLVSSPDRTSRNNFNLDHREFGPRIGFAYGIASKTVLRGGYGVFWLPNNLEFWLSPNLDALNDHTTNFVASIDGGVTPYNNLSSPFPNGLTLPPGRNPIYQSLFLGQSIYSELPNTPNPYMQQWNFDAQRELRDGTLVDIAYSGSKGTHLHALQQSIDQLPDKDMALGTSLETEVANPFYGLITSGTLSAPTVAAGQLLRPFPQYQTVAINGLPDRDSIYHSMQLKVEKRMQGGGTILVAYTIGKLITTADSLTGWLNTADLGVSSPGYATQDNNDIKGERSLADYDVPQRLVISYILDLPFGRGRKYWGHVSGFSHKLISGWGVDGISTFQRGFPLQFSTAESLTGTYDGGSRPNFNLAACPSGASSPGSAESRLNQWFDTRCFSQPPAFTWGNVSRTEPNLRSDGMRNFDFALFKNTTLRSEKLGLQFRAEFFNFFNTVQFGPPGQTQGTAQFGMVSSQLNEPRLVQFALRLSF